MNLIVLKREFNSCDFKVCLVLSVFTLNLRAWISPTLSLHDAFVSLRSCLGEVPKFQLRVKINVD